MRLIDRLQDLRFVIGLFFGILSLILLIAGAGFEPAGSDVLNLNLIVGSVMGVFALGMLGISVFSAVEEPQKRPTQRAAGERMVETPT